MPKSTLFTKKTTESFKSVSFFVYFIQNRQKGNDRKRTVPFSRRPLFFLIFCVFLQRVSADIAAFFCSGDHDDLLLPEGGRADAVIAPEAFGEGHNIHIPELFRDG